MTNCVTLEPNLNENRPPEYLKNNLQALSRVVPILTEIS